jgi:hypothetical protein
MNEGIKYFLLAISILALPGWLLMWGVVFEKYKLLIEELFAKDEPS